MLDVLQPRANEAMLCGGLLGYIKTPRDTTGRQNGCPLLSYKSIKASKTNHRKYRNYPKESLFLKLIKQDLGLSHSQCFKKVNCFLLSKSREEQLL